MHAKGFILGLLLFLIYVNDFQNCLQKGKALMFADDTTIFFQHKCLSELTLTTNTQLENVNKWLIANKLSLNITKTNYIILQTPSCKQSTKPGVLKLGGAPPWGGVESLQGGREGGRMLNYI